MRSRVVLLGPQRFDPTVAATVESLGIDGEIASVTAGWQEREAEDAELRDHLLGMGSRTVNLMLHRRGEDVFQTDREFAAGHRLRQERLRQLQTVYRAKLAHAKEASLQVLAMKAEPWLIEPEIEEAIGAVARLDDHHARRVEEIDTEFEKNWKPLERDVIARHREEIRGIVEASSAIAIAGGHVAVLLNRMRLFDVAGLVGHRPILAWSAGAMVVSHRIVLFHDSPPQGAGTAELLSTGLGLFPGVVALPHASTRLRLDDPKRVSFLARRFGPEQCVALDKGTRLDWDGLQVAAAPGTRVLTASGRLEEMVAA